MAHHHGVDAVDRTLQDFTGAKIAFADIPVLFSGDFRQLAPIVEKGTENDCIRASVIHSSFWPTIKKHQLTHPFRQQNDPDFAKFALRVGSDQEERFHIDDEHVIKLPATMHNADNIDALIHNVYGDIQTEQPETLAKRAVLSPLNVSIDEINGVCLERLPGQKVTLMAWNTLIKKRNQ